CPWRAEDASPRKWHDRSVHHEAKLAHETAHRSLVAFQSLHAFGVAGCIRAGRLLTHIVPAFSAALPHLRRVGPYHRSTVVLLCRRRAEGVGCTAIAGSALVRFSTSWFTVTAAREILSCDGSRL